MAIFLLPLLLRVGFVIGSNYKYEEFSDNEGDPEIRAKQLIYNSDISQPELHGHTSYLLKPATEQSALVQKIDDDLPRVVTAFLHTGDSSTLKHANCSRRYELNSLRGPSHLIPHSSLRSVLDTVMHATNFLNMILQANRSRQHSLRRDIEWYHALVRSILEGDPKIQRAVVTFNAETSSSDPHVFLQGTRTEGGIVLQDLSSTAHHHLKNKTAETEWFSEIRDRRKPHLHRRILSQEIKSADASLRRGESYILDHSEVKWSAPYLECENGNFVPQWLLTLSAGFYGLKPNQAPEFRGVVRVDINLQDLDIDQCSTHGWFAGTHRCNLTSMECLPLPGHGFVLDKYRCPCRQGFYHPSRVVTSSVKRKAEGDGVARGDPWAGSSACLPCREGCAYCKDDAPCHAHRDGPLRVTTVAFQGFCMLADFASMVAVYHFRRNKSIRASGLVLLETILFGALLLYFPVGILYLPPSTFRCILLRWARLLGFAIVYGTVTLKLYRVLKVFLSRTAQRIPYMTSWRVLHLLAVILLIVCWFLVAWTMAVCQNLNKNLPLVDVGLTSDGLQFSMCLLDRWDYMMAVGELLFLLWAVYLCYAVRTVPSAFHEPRYMAVAVHNELIISGIFHIIRFTSASGLHPDWMLMLFFTHTHLTVTVTLGLMLIPKFLFTGTHTRDDMATETYEDELDMGRSGSYLNSSITSAWSEHSLDPEDIREELKKLYAQLEVYKRKKMMANNPHLQKKRSSKKGLGRSLMRRITEIPESVSRQCSKEDKDLGDHGNNRNSICTPRKNPFDPSHSSKPKEESLKSKVFSLKKSHSSYDHVRDQSEDSSNSAAGRMEIPANESSLLDSLMGRKMVRKKSEEKMEMESAESVPLVCKSASAHNLTADKKPIHVRSSVLQKSLSVIASAKERTLGLTGKAQHLEDNSKKGFQKGKECRTHLEREEIPPQDTAAIKAVNETTEHKAAANKVGIMKGQCGSSQPSLCAEPGKNIDLCDLSEVCPWELEELAPPSENKVQKHVSIAPQETTLFHGGSAKGKPQLRLRDVDQYPSNGRHSSQQVNERDQCAWYDGDESQGMIDGTTPTPVQPQPAGGMVEVRDVHICAQDFDELPARRDEAAKLSDKGGFKVDAPADGKEEGHQHDHAKPNAMPRAELWPWDYDLPKSPNSEGSDPAHLSKLKDSLSRTKGAPSSKTSEMEKEKDDERGRLKSRDGGEKWVSQSKMEEVCPWGADNGKEALSEDTRSSYRSGAGATANKQADICPWDFQDVSDNKEPSRTPRQGSNTSKGVLSKSRMADVCPWDFDEETPGQNA